MVYGIFCNPGKGWCRKGVIWDLCLLSEAISRTLRFVQHESIRYEGRNGSVMCTKHRPDQLQLGWIIWITGESDVGLWFSIGLIHNGSVLCGETAC